MQSDAVTTDLLEFIRLSPTPYHAVENAISRLAAAGFTELDTAASWADLAAGRYYVKQGDSALLAFAVPASRTVRGFRIVGAHTDSPNLRLKPNAEYVKEGYAQLGVEVYGGALLNSWLDRDLSIAGRAVVKSPKAAHPSFDTRLVKFERPLCRVAQLAIHLDREVNEKGVVLNKQEHLAPLFGMSASGKEASRPPLATMVATQLGTTANAIVSLELMLYDLNPPSLGGPAEEFIFSARLDNLAMSHAATAAIAKAAERVDERKDLVPMIALFDHEEVGSGSAYGAEAPLLPAVIERIVSACGGSRDDYHRAVSRSLCVSADMAHAVHPNYADRSEARHKVALNGGPVVKTNAQQRYATCARTAALFEEICRVEDVPVQTYVHRTDLPCGSTIGPITATRLGIRTVDVGNAMLSMHSCRELAGARDPERMVRVLASFFGTEDPFAA